MIIDTELIFRYLSPIPEKLKERGFAEENGVFTRKQPIANGDFSLIITVGGDKTDYKVIDNAFGEEYFLIKVGSAEGAFINSLRAECENILKSLASECFFADPLVFSQTKRVIQYIKEAFSAEPEYLWAQYPKYAVFRCAENQKWFAIIMSVPRCKIGLDGNGDIEIINLKAKPIPENAPGIYPAYHMNKKHWISVPLDATLGDDDVFRLINDSYNLLFSSTFLKKGGAKNF